MKRKERQLEHFFEPKRKTRHEEGQDSEEATSPDVEGPLPGTEFCYYYINCG
jgi:hypothetical protein